MKRKLPLWLALFVICVLVESAAAATSPEESLPELIRRVKPSVVSVITYNAKNEVLITGSGFFIRPGQVVTNLHVLEGADHAAIRTFDGKGKTYAVDGLVDVDEEGDLATMSIGGMPVERARVLETTNVMPEEGEKIFVIGNPLRLEGSVADGIVSAVREVPGLGKIVQITAPISHGNSGSPVFNMRGQVVGVVTIRVMNGQNINLAIASPRIAEMRAGVKLLSFDELATRTRLSQQPEAVSEWWYRNGLNSLWLGNYESALGSFENAVNKNPDRAEAWIQVGYCKVKQGKNQDAIKAFQQALRLRPNSYEAYNKLGDAYYFAANYDKAVAAYKRAALLRPGEPEAHYNLGMTYLELGDRASASVESQLLKTLDTDLYKKLSGEIER